MDRSWYATTYLTTAAAMLALTACNPFRSPFRQAPVVEVTRSEVAAARLRVGADLYRRQETPPWIRRLASTGA